MGENLDEELKKLQTEKDQLFLTATALEKKYNVPGFITKLAEQLGQNQNQNQGQNSAENVTYGFGGATSYSGPVEKDELKNVKNKLEDALSNHISPVEIAAIIDQAKSLLEARKSKIKEEQQKIKDLKKEENRKLIERNELQVQHDDLIKQSE